MFQIFLYCFCAVSSAYLFLLLLLFFLFVALKPRCCMSCRSSCVCRIFLCRCRSLGGSLPLSDKTIIVSFALLFDSAYRCASCAVALATSRSLTTQSRSVLVESALLFADSAYRCARLSLAAAESRSLATVSRSLRISSALSFAKSASSSASFALLFSLAASFQPNIQDIVN